MANNNARWWQTGVIYQIYPRSFMDSNNDGIGDLMGTIARLDYLLQLGIDAVWFSPLFPSPQADFGYDVANYEDVNPEYGTLADMDRFIAEAHQRGIRVILDMVPNHTSDEHAWFVESRSSRDNPKRDWYIWRDPASDGGPPNNWMSYFNGPAWTFDPHTGQYYLHNFDTKQPELNWRNPAVETAIFNSIRFWLRRGVDGFRIDVIDRLMKDPQFRDNPPDPNWKSGDPEIFKYQRVYSEMRSPELFAILERMRGVFDEFDDRVMIGEVIYDATIEQLARYYGTPQGDGGTNGIHLPFNFQLIQMPWKAESIRAFVDPYDRGLPDYAWPNYVRNNHDRERFASLHGQAQARVLAIMLLTLRGTPTLYYGDEIGMVNVPVPADQIKDPAAKGGNFNRDECRSPMQWDASPNAGFSGAGVKTWLPVASDYAQRNVANQLTDPDSLLSLYRRLLAYRRDTDTLTMGSYQSLDAPDGCFVYLREYSDQRLLIALNLTADAKSVALPGLGSGQVVIATHCSCEGQAVDLTDLALGPDEGVIIALS